MLQNSKVGNGWIVTIHTIQKEWVHLNVFVFFYIAFLGCFISGRIKVIYIYKMHPPIANLHHHCDKTRKQMMWDRFLTMSPKHALKPFISFLFSFRTFNKTPRSQSPSCLHCLFTQPEALVFQRPVCSQVEHSGCLSKVQSRNLALIVDVRLIYWDVYGSFTKRTGLKDRDVWRRNLEAKDAGVWKCQLPVPCVKKKKKNPEQSVLPTADQLL